MAIGEFKLDYWLTIFHSSGTHNHKQGPNSESTGSPRLIFHFNHWAEVIISRS